MGHPNTCEIEFMYVFGYHRKLSMRYQHLKQFPIVFNLSDNDYNISTNKCLQNQLSKRKKTFCKLRRDITF